MYTISGPLVDRIDIHIEVPAVPFRELSGGAPGTSSAEMRRQVMAARAIQSERFRGSPTRYNGDMTHRQIRQFCKLDEEGMNMLRASMAEMGLSARAHDKILRTARTIADLDSSAEIRPNHLSEGRSILWCDNDPSDLSYRRVPDRGTLYAVGRVRRRDGADNRIPKRAGRRWAEGPRFSQPIRATPSLYYTC